MSDIDLSHLRQGARVGDVLVGAAQACGIDVASSASVAGAHHLGLTPAAKACVVLVDGLGWYNLQASSDDGPFLAEAAQMQAQSAIPSTTATNLTFLGTGKEGGMTAMLGYTVRDRVGKMLNLVSWNSAQDPQQWQREPTVFEQIAAQGRLAVSIGPWKFADSGLTRAALRGSEYSPANTLRQRVDAALSHLRDPEVDIVYLYWGELDATGHRVGWRTEEWHQQLRELDEQLERLDRLKPPGAALLVTADHGMVDIPPQGRIDIASRHELQDGVELVAGEPRALHVYAERQRARQIEANWRNALADGALIFTRNEAIDRGLFGPVARASESVIGDLVVFATGEEAIIDSRRLKPGHGVMIGMHGSITPWETTVPVVVRNA